MCSPGGKDLAGSLRILSAAAPHGPTSVVPGKNTDRIFIHQKTEVQELSTEGLKLDVRRAGRESRKEGVGSCRSVMNRGRLIC